VTPLRPQGGYGKRLTTSWTADLPGTLASETVDPLQMP
jgi:hypothetical protein